MIFETHAHYDDEAFNEDRQALLLSMPENGIGRIVNVGSSLETTRQSIALAHKYDTQKKWFIRQLELARKVKKPVIIHSREAAKDTYDIMVSENASEIGGIVHCYSYSSEMALDYVKMGFYIGIGGVVTFKNGKKMKDVVKALPIDRIVLETDSPYLSPEPNRGKRNSSLNLPYIAAKIAEIKNLTYDEVVEATRINAYKAYRLEE
jgi:TatD DNase family protein